MANIIVRIVEDAGKGIEVAAEDVLKFAVSEGTKAIAAAPGVLAALGVLATGVEKAAVDAETDAANPLTLLLGGAAQVADFAVLWPEVKAFLATLGITKI